MKEINTNIFGILFIFIVGLLVGMLVKDGIDEREKYKFQNVETNQDSLIIYPYEIKISEKDTIYFYKYKNK